MCLRGLIQSAEEPRLFLSRRGLFVSPPRVITAVITTYIPSLSLALVLAERADKKAHFAVCFIYVHIRT